MCKKKNFIFQYFHNINFLYLSLILYSLHIIFNYYVIFYLASFFRIIYIYSFAITILILNEINSRTDIGNKKSTISN